MKALKREKLFRRRNLYIEMMVKIMRDHGASDRAIRKAVPGIAELSKFYVREADKLYASESGNPPPSLDPYEEALGFFLSEVERQEVQWLWKKLIPLGKITILDGDPGMGKSLLALNLAACVSTGSRMPDDTPGKQGGVVLIAPEDGAGDTLRPRLEAAGGDPSRVLLLNTVDGLDTQKLKIRDRPFSLSHDLEKLEEAIKRINAVLVILDPLMAVLGHSIDASRDQDIREVFTPLAQLAERTGCAVLIIRHLNKGASENFLYRGAGSIGIIAAARIGLLVAQDPYEENRRVLATTKNNLSKQVPHLSFEVLENESGIPYIQWHGENNYTLATLLDGETHLSIERQQILQALKDASGPLGPQEIADLTGQKYTSVRNTLSRMHEAREITRCSRGKYTALHHPSLLQKSTHNDAKTSDTTDTTDTSDTSDTLDTTDTSDAIVPNLISVG